jgi:predicted transport protein
MGEHAERRIDMQVDEMEAKMAANIADKMGQPLEVWIQVVKKEGISKHNEIIKFLKSEHDFTHGYANFVALKVRQPAGGSSFSGDELVNNQYSSAKADLRPIYEVLIAAVKEFDEDVEIAPKKAYVSLRRNKQFSLIQPSTKTRVDVGIILKGADPQGRLEAAGSFNSMCSHRVRITDQAEVNAELIDWLKKAYEAA